MQTLFQVALAASVLASLASQEHAGPAQTRPSRSETIEPMLMRSFDRQGKTPMRRQGGNPRQQAGLLVFDGATDGNRQVDPQVAVGGGHVLHATNHGLHIYDREGAFVSGVSQRGFAGGIDPKLFFCRNNRVFGFDLWNPWDKAKQKPVNISVSRTDDPSGAWATYSVPAPNGVDGGGVGVSRRWIGYSFPGGEERTFVLPIASAKAGEPVTVHHFRGSLGHPVLTQDPEDDLYFVQLTRRDICIRKVTATAGGAPVAVEVARAPHRFGYFGWPPKSPQKGTTQETASGDRNPKNIVLQGGYLWFSHTVACDGRAAVQWHQVRLDGTFVQSGRLSSGTSSYIQTSLAVNERLDVLVGFQETSADMFISPRLAYRRASDPLGSLRPMSSLGEGRGATDGLAWGDYSGSAIDGDNGLDLWTVQSIAGADGKGDCVIARLPAAAGTSGARRAASGEQRAVSAAGLTLRVPTAWQQHEPISAMRVMQFKLLGPSDEESAELAVFRFPGGGGLDANIRRWVGQFAERGRTVRVTQGVAEQGDYVLVEVAGTYNKPVGAPMRRQTRAVPGQRMIAVILTRVGADSPFFIKAVGEDRVVAAAAAAIRAAFGGRADAESARPVRGL